MATEELSAADTIKTTIVLPSHRFYLLPPGADEWEGTEREGSFSQEGVQQSGQGWGSGQGHRGGHGGRLTHLLRCANLASAAGCPPPTCPKPVRADPPGVALCLQPGSALRPPVPAAPSRLAGHRRSPSGATPIMAARYPRDGRPGAPRAAPNMAAACECRGGRARR